MASRSIHLKAFALAALMANLAPAAMAAEVEERVAVCAGCHGPQGHSAVPDNPVLAAQYASYLSLALQAYINGDRDYGIMKTMAERLSAEDVEVITAYYAAQPPYQSQAPVVGDSARGANKAVACSACHGPNGNSLNPEFPKLAGQHATYLAHTIRAYRSGARENSLMQAVTQTLSDEDIADIAAYFATQAPQAKETAR